MTMKCIRQWFPISRILTCIIVSGCWIMPATAQQGKQSEKLRQNKTKLEQEIRTTGDLLEKTKKTRQSSLSQIKILDKQIRSRENLINTINQELQQAEIQMIYESLQIDRMSKRLKLLRNEYARIIRQSYRLTQGQSKLMFLFSAKDFNEAYQRLKYYQQLASYRRSQAARIEAASRTLRLHMNELEVVKTQKQELLEAKNREKIRLDQEKKQKDKTIKTLASREKELMAELKKKQQAAKKLNSEIENAINAEIRASEDLKRKKAGSSAAGGSKKGSAAKPASPGKLELTPEETQISSSFSANRGKLPWPCERGFISENYGSHTHPVLKHVTVKNNGIDILTESGASIRAVFGGKVTKVMSFQHLNKVVIIRHGEYLTVYSNLSEVHVREGDIVKAKQSIGTVHAGEGESRAELHFELWKGKTILNPEYWLTTR